MDLFGMPPAEKEAVAVVKNFNQSNLQVSLHDPIFSATECNSLFHNLKTKIEWEQRQIRIFGKLIPQPRLSAFYGDAHQSYIYSGLLWQAKTWNEDLLKIKLRVEELCKQSFTSVLLNYYRDGNDSMGWHSDDEKELGSNPIIASISFGETRSFQMRHRFDRNTEKVNIPLTNGALLIMEGSTQHFWQHQIPKSKNSLKPRINLTFRQIKN